MTHLRLRSCLVLLVATGVTACGTVAGDRYAGNTVVSETGAMANCRYLGSLSGTSGLSGLFALKGADNVRQNLLRQADAMGATHVVWDRPDVSLTGTTVVGKAYACPASASAPP